jgi:hypothetical protein
MSMKWPDARVFRNLAAFSGGLALLATGACLGSTDPQEGLTQSEAYSFVDALAAAHAFNGQFGASDPWPCPSGGSADHNLSTVISEDGNVQTTTGTITYQDCRSSLFGFSGQVSYNQTFVYNPSGPPELSGLTQGQLQWALGGRTGMCQISLQIGLGETGTAVGGIACGHQVGRVY